MKKPKAGPKKKRSPPVVDYRGQGYTLDVRGADGVIEVYPVVGLEVASGGAWVDAGGAEPMFVKDRYAMNPPPKYFEAKV